MHGIDVFVLPSLTEGTPNAIIEAMSHGKPIIATAVGGIPDVVSEEVGILVPPNDVKALASAMSLLAGDADLRQRMGIAARRKYEQLFTPPVVVPMLLDLYERVTDKHSTQNGSNGSNNGERPRATLDHPWSMLNL